MKNKPMGILKTVEPTLEEKKEIAFDKVKREVRIASARANIVKSEITEAYRILENIRFDYIGDTAFREKIVSAKSNLEYALMDFLMDDSYWKKREEGEIVK